MITAELNVVENALRAAKSQFSHYHQVMKAASVASQAALKPEQPKRAAAAPKPNKK